MPARVVGLGRVQVRRPISASSAIAASSSCAGRAPLQTWPQAKVGTWTRRFRQEAAGSSILPEADTQAGAHNPVAMARTARALLLCVLAALVELSLTLHSVPAAAAAQPLAPEAPAALLPPQLVVTREGSRGPGTRRKGRRGTALTTFWRRR